MSISSIYPEFFIFGQQEPNMIAVFGLSAPVIPLPNLLPNLSPSPTSHSAKTKGPPFRY
jgi:hypothetical protein